MKALTTRKTNYDGQTSYTYNSVIPGYDETVIVGRDGVTEINIHQLINEDNREVENNLRNLGPELTEEQKKWNKDHEGEKLERPWNLSLDGFVSDEDGSDTAERAQQLYGAAIRQAEVPHDVERLYEILEEFSPKQRRIYELVRIQKKLTCREAGEMAGYSESYAARSIRKIDARIASDEVLKKFFS